MIRRVAVNQAPGGGTVYPFLEENDLTDVILDVYVCYDDPENEFEPPFTFTFQPTVSPDFAVDISDANAVSLLAASLSTTDNDVKITDWGSDRRVYEWVVSPLVLRVVARPVAVPNILINTSAILDPTTCNRLPGRVRSLNGMTGVVAIHAGYNISLAVTETEPADGKRRTSRIMVSAIPGAGLGRRSGCEDEVPLLKTINGQGAAPGGNFKIILDDCYRSQLPLTMVNTPQDAVTVRQATYQYAGLTNEEAGAGLVLFNDCRPCCSCEDYVRVYKGLKVMWERWKAAAQDAEAARDTFAANIERWLAQKSCREDNPIHTVAQSQTTCRVFLGVNYCNVTKCCLTNIEIRLTLQLFEDGEPIDWPDTATVLDAYIETSYTDTRDPYVPIRDGSVYRFFIDYANPGDNTVVAMRLCVDCPPATEDDPDPPQRSIRMTATVHIPDPANDPDGNPCTLPTQTIADDIQNIWSIFSVPAEPTPRAVDDSKDTPLNPDPPVSPGCCPNCED